MSTTRYIKLDKEDTFGDGGQGNDTKFLKVADADFQTEFEFDELEEINRASLEESYRVLKEGSGSWTMWGRANELPMLLHALFGDVDMVDVGADVDTKQLNFEPDEDGIFSFEIEEGKPKKAYRYKGQLIQEMTITAEVGEVMTIEVTTTGNGASSSENKTDDDNIDYVDIEKCPPFRLVNASIEIGDTDKTNVRSVTITYNNNISDDEHTLGSLDIQEEPPAQRREIEIDFEFSNEEDSVYDDFIDGTTAELDLTFETDTEIEDGHPYKMEWMFPKIQYREHSASQSGRDPVRADVPARALFEEDYEYNNGDGNTTTDTEVVCTLVCDDTDNVSE